MSENTPDKPLARRTSSDVCVHCRQPIVSEAPDPRWRGWCARCAKALSSHHQFESA